MESKTFSVVGELPGRGITLLEASAGTGKTFSIAALLTRYIAAGECSMDQVLIVTFTRNATSELRSRVRDRLAGAIRGLEGLVRGEPNADSEDQLVSFLAADSTDVRLQLERLRRAMADFDLAEISTIHGFCDRASKWLGLSACSALNSSVAGDLQEVETQCAIDTYVSTFGASEELRLEASKATAFASVVLANPEAEIFPTRPADDADADRFSYAHELRTQLQRRKNRLGVVSHDDQVVRLARAIRASSVEATARLRDRFSLVMVDEFQDTDQTQWEILHSAFGDGSVRLILIGDPKQAIYSFRGGDIHAYLMAREKADICHLGVNYRSTPELLSALDVLFNEAPMGTSEIHYEPLTPGTEQGGEASGQAAVRFVQLDSEGFSPSERTQEGQVRLPAAAAAVAQAVGVDIVDRLQQTNPPARPGDIAVIVATNQQASQVADALRQRAVPVVVRSPQSVFETTAADVAEKFLAALAAPDSDRAIRRLAVTDVIRLTMSDLVDDNPSPTAPLSMLRERVRDWLATYDAFGVEAAFAAVMDEYDAPRQILTRANGERFLTDLDHVIELAGIEARSQQLSVPALLSWLTDRMVSGGTTDDEVARRLETDTEAVQVITTHAAKGLEFPIVYCPTLWHSFPQSPDRSFVFHDPQGGRGVYVGIRGSRAGREAAELRRGEQLGEARRQLYVATTRAKRELVIHICETSNRQSSPLFRLLDRHGPTTRAAIEKMAHECAHITSSRPHPFTAEPRVLSFDGDLAESSRSAEIRPARSFDRVIDQRWRRASFSSMTAAAHEAHYGSGNSESMLTGTKTDETDEPVAPYQPPVDSALSDMRSVMSDLRGGTAFGSYVHFIFEHVDFRADPLESAIADAAHMFRRDTNLTDLQERDLVSGIVNCLRTPLGADLGGVTLAEVSRPDRVDEMAFELPLAGAEQPSGYVSPQLIGDVLEQYLAPDDELREYLPYLHDDSLAVGVRGYLTGSIDLVFRTAHDGVPRYSVVDYKTNRLGPAELTAWDYRPQAVQRAVFQAHYPLQFLLYTVALHRYLRSRMPDYDPALHLGPVKYLFVRGMFGATNPEVDGRGCGIFTWQPTPLVVDQLSKLLAVGVGG